MSLLLNALDLYPSQGNILESSTIQYSPNGEEILTFFEDKSTLVRWSSTNKNQIGMMINVNPYTIADFSYIKQGTEVLVRTLSGIIFKYNITTESWSDHKYTENEPGPGPLAVSPNQRNFITAGEKGILYKWDLREPSKSSPFTIHNDYISKISYTPNGRGIITASFDGTLGYWDSDTLEPIFSPISVNAFDIWSLKVHPNGTEALLGADQGTIFKYNLIKNSISKLPVNLDKGAIYSIEFSPDGSQVITGSSDKTILIYDYKTLTPITHLIKKHSGDVVSLSYSPNGKEFISGSWDSKVYIWKGLNYDTLQTDATLQPTLLRKGFVI